MKYILFLPAQFGIRGEYHFPPGKYTNISHEFVVAHANFAVDPAKTPKNEEE